MKNKKWKNMWKMRVFFKSLPCCTFFNLNAWRYPGQWHVLIQRCNTCTFVDGRQTHATWQQQSSVPQTERRSWSTSVRILMYFTQDTHIWSYARSAQTAQSEDHLESQGIGPFWFDDHPILGIRIGPQGQRLVYCINPPRDQVCDQTTVCRLC